MGSTYRTGPIRGQARKNHASSRSVASRRYGCLLYLGLAGQPPRQDSHHDPDPVLGVGFHGGNTFRYYGVAYRDQESEETRSSSQCDQKPPDEDMTVVQSDSSQEYCDASERDKHAEN